MRTIANWTTTFIVLAAAAVACAAGKTSSRDNLSGQWSGYIDRDGWERQLSIRLTNENGAYRGSWMSMEWQPGVIIDRVDVNGDEIRFQLNDLAFAGHVSGRTLTGDVKDQSSGQTSGQFLLMRLDPPPEVVP